MNRTDSLVSIITPVYNAGAYLAPLIESVLSQKYQNFELILVDDGSMDGSGEICDQYALKEKRVISIHQPNGGQSSARNHGLEIAHGSYIAFADHDDILHPYMIKTLMRALEKTNMEVAACQFRHTSDQELSCLRFDSPIANGYAVSQGELLHRFFTPDWHIPIWNKLYRRDVLETISFHSAMLGEDNLFSYRVIKKIPAVFFYPAPLYYQRIHHDNFEFTGIRHMVELLSAKETILQDLRLSFPTEFPHALSAFLLECVRIYNLYESEGTAYSEQQEKVLRILRNNASDVVHADLPARQKLRFVRICLFGKKSIHGAITI